MPDAQGHSWAGLDPRTCRNCGAIEGSKEVWEPCVIAKTAKKIGFTFDNVVGRHRCRGRLYLQDDGTTYCYKCDEVVEEL